MRTYNDYILGAAVGFFVGVFATMFICASHASAQSSQTLTYDLRVLRHNVEVCKNDYWHFKRQGKPMPALTKEQLADYCINRALARYRERVQTEERLIEGMTKDCCPNVRTPPATPRYQEKKEKEYQVQRPQGDERQEIEQIIAKLKEGLE